MIRSSEGLHATPSALRPCRSAREGDGPPAEAGETSSSVESRVWEVTSKMKAWRGEPPVLTAATWLGGGGGGRALRSGDLEGWRVRDPEET